MGTRGKERDVLPYRGEIRWLPRSRRWSLTVCGWSGHPDLKVPAAEVFDDTTLTVHLSTANMKPDLAELSGVECTFTLRVRGKSIDEIGSAILRVLRRHYSHHKGRPIVWGRARDGSL
jgi:hypothetical protein